MDAHGSACAPRGSALLGSLHTSVRPRPPRPGAGARSLGSVGSAESGHHRDQDKEGNGEPRHRARPREPPEEPGLTATDVLREHGDPVARLFWVPQEHKHPGTAPR